MQMQMPMMTAAGPGYQPQAVFQSMTMTQQQQQPFGAAMNQPLYTGMMVPAPGSVQPQQPFAGMMNPGMGQQWPGNPNTNPYASGGASQGQWYG